MNQNATGKARSGLEGHGAYCFLIEVTVDFEGEDGRAVPFHDQGRIDRRQVGPGKDDIHDRPPDGMHHAVERQAAIIHLCAVPDAGRVHVRCRV